MLLSCTLMYLFFYFSSLNGTSSDDSNSPIMQKFPRPKAVNKARWTKEEVCYFKIIFTLLLINHINLLKITYVYYLSIHSLMNFKKLMHFMHLLK